MTSCHLGHAARVVELLGLELVVILPGFQEAFQKGAVRDADFGPDFEFQRC